MLTKDFKEFVALLKKHEAEYMIVGGYAVGVHVTHATPATWTSG